MLPTVSARQRARHGAPFAASPATSPTPSVSAPAGGRIGTPWRTALASLTLAALVTACALPTHHDADAAPFDPFNPAATQLLDDTSWELTSWKQADGTPIDVPRGDDGGPVTLIFSTAGGQRRVSGFSGCNRYMGTYALKDGTVTFGPLAGTRMACASGGKIESAYLAALTHIDRTGVQLRPPQQLQMILDSGDTLTFARRAG